MSPFLTEKRYCFKILLKLPREQYFLHFVFSILSLEESYNNIVLQSFFHTHTHTHARARAPDSAKIEPYFKGQFKTYSSAPFHPFLELPFLILCNSSPTWL